MSQFYARYTYRCLAGFESAAVTDSGCLRVRGKERKKKATSCLWWGTSTQKENKKHGIFNYRGIMMAHCLTRRSVWRPTHFPACKAAYIALYCFFFTGQAPISTFHHIFSTERAPWRALYHGLSPIGASKRVPVVFTKEKLQNKVYSNQTEIENLVNVGVCCWCTLSSLFAHKRKWRSCY